jgi:hypothetical protein
MSALGLVLIVIGFALIVVGVKGTQKAVSKAFTGVKQGQTQSLL